MEWSPCGLEKTARGGAEKRGGGSTDERRFTQTVQERRRWWWLRQVLECASPLALSDAILFTPRSKAAEGCRTPSRSRDSQSISRISVLCVSTTESGWDPWRDEFELLDVGCNRLNLPTNLMVKLLTIPHPGAA